MKRNPDLRTLLSLITLTAIVGSCSRNPPLVYLSRQGVGGAEETQRYYDAMGRDGGRPAAANLGAWFAERCFDKSAVEAFYYNPTDLGLGREMRCALCPDGDPRAGLLSCAVSNHGKPLGIDVKGQADAKKANGEAISEVDVKGFRDRAIDSALKAVDAYVNQHKMTLTQISTQAPFRGATVAMDYDPRLPVNERVRFFIYDGEDPDKLTAPNTTPAGLIPGLQLDNEGVKFIRNCLNCHGGVYDEARDTIVGSSFLDFNTPLLQFGGGVTTQSANQDPLRSLNELVLKTQPAVNIRNRVCVNYKCQNDGSLALSDAPSALPPTPAWSVAFGTHSAMENQTLYSLVLDKYCATCHFSQSPESVPLTVQLRDQSLNPDLLAKRPITFGTPEQWFDSELQRFIVQSVCQSSDMPHAEVTRMNLLQDIPAFGLLCGAQPATSGDRK